MSTTRWLLPALALLLAGCFSGPADEPGVVHDLRVLAMRLDPPEVEVGMTKDAPAADVTISVLVAAPDASTVQLTLRGCESPSSEACDGALPSDPERARLLDPVLETQTQELDVAPAPPSSVAHFERTLPNDMLLDLLSNAGALALAGARPAFEVSADAADGAERAFKRLQVSFPDAAYRMALAEAGVEICDEQGLPDGCVDYRTRTPNTNPTIESILVRRDSEGPDATFSPFPEHAPLEVHAGEPVTILPRAADGSAEPYQTLTLDVENRKVVVENRQELLVYSWFATAGFFDLDRTEEERTLDVRNTWTAPTDVPAGGEDAFAWIVLRDTRGGVDFRTLSFRVLP